MNIPRTMSGVALMGHGGPEMLEWNDNLPVPEIGAGEVLLKVLAAGVNNTDINTRTGWYSKSVTGATTDDNITSDASDGTWDGNALTFPHIQGADCCGEVVAVGDSVDPARIGERVIVRTMQNWVDTDGKSKSSHSAPSAKAPSRSSWPRDPSTLSRSTPHGQISSWLRSLAPQLPRKACCNALTSAQKTS